MPKPTIFLSHINQERELADLFRVEIEKRFLGLVTVFQSSDPTSLPLGQNWLNNITDALTTCEAILLFCSPESVKRPWINFECGAGWARKIEVAPLCHSGMRPVDLPVPISLLQGMEAHDSKSLTQIFSMIARKLGSTAPIFDTSALAQSVSVFETAYIEEALITSKVQALFDIAPDLVKTIAPLPVSVFNSINGFPERLVERCHVPLDALQSAGVLSYSFHQNETRFGGPGSGAFGAFNVIIDPRLSRALAAVVPA